jgi:hypothetical protein
MTRLSLSEVRDRSGIDPLPGETLSEYLRRVGTQTDMPAQDIEAVIDYANQEQFSPTLNSSEGTDAPVDEFIQAIESLGENGEPGASTADEESVAAGDDPADEESAAVGLPPDDQGTMDRDPTQSSNLFSESGTLGRPSNTDDGVDLRLPFALLGVVVLVGMLLAGGVVIMGSDTVPFTNDNEDSADDNEDSANVDTPEEDDDDSSSGDENDRVPIDVDGEGDDEAASYEESESPSTEVVDSASEVSNSLEVTEMLVDGTNPDEEFIELTNVGDATIDMSEWTVRDRENDGAVDARGIEPATFPDGFELGPGESVRLVTASGEDTEDTVYWGYEDRQNWRGDGDVIIVLDGDGEEVLRHEYGTIP